MHIVDDPREQAAVEQAAVKRAHLRRNVSGSLGASRLLDPTEAAC